MIGYKFPVCHHPLSMFIPSRGRSQGGFRRPAPFYLHQNRQLCKEHSSKQPAVSPARLQQPWWLPQPHKLVPAEQPWLCSGSLHFGTAPSLPLLQSKHSPEQHQELTESSDSDWRHSSTRKKIEKHNLEGFRVKKSRQESMREHRTISCIPETSAALQGHSRLPVWWQMGLSMREQTMWCRRTINGTEDTVPPRH